MCINEWTNPIGKDYEEQVNRCNVCNAKTVVVGEENGYRIRVCKHCVLLTADKNKQEDKK